MGVRVDGWMYGWKGRDGRWRRKKLNSVEEQKRHFVEREQQHLKMPVFVVCFCCSMFVLSDSSSFFHVALDWKVVLNFVVQTCLKFSFCFCLLFL